MNIMVDFLTLFSCELLTQQILLEAGNDYFAVLREKFVSYDENSITLAR